MESSGIIMLAADGMLDDDGTGEGLIDDGIEGIGGKPDEEETAEAVGIAESAGDAPTDATRHGDAWRPRYGDGCGVAFVVPGGERTAVEAASERTSSRCEGMR
mmetsp:Transcript_27733/g.54226  ORF Transcript_27733/g.54226 Transcript_27733/m.54226 type:complete len:103 (-) Transcript_27733:1074-1382(-)